MIEGRKFLGRMIGLAFATAVGVLIAMPIASAQTTTTTSSFNPGTLLIVGLIGGVVCALIAKSKGRSILLWAVLGFCFPLILLIILAFMKKQTPAAPAMMPPKPMMDAPPPPPAPPQAPSDSSGF